MSDFQNIIKEIKKAINGKDRAIITSLLAILANGNILIEDIPGVGKTTMAVAFSKALGLEYKRVQFTPDTLPSDITGFTTYDKSSNTLRFTKGAIFCNLFLADELNRTSSRTQSALLEAMEEKQVTVSIKTGSGGRSFGSVSTKEIAAAAKSQLGYELDKKKMELDVPIKSPGTFNVKIKLHKEVTAELRVVVKEA